MQLRNMLAFALASGTLLSACDDSTNAGAGKVTVQMTDAPFPFAEVRSVDIFIVRVDAKTQETTDADAANADNNGSWTTIATPGASIDLMALNGGKLTTLGTSSLANGTYRGFRLVIDPAQSSITLKDDSQPDIMWPSANRTGIKVNLMEPLVVSSDSSVFIIDFDIGASFVMRGNDISQNGLLFKPVVQAIATDITGSISGRVVTDAITGSPMEGATVELLKDGTALDDTESDNVVRTTVTDADGEYAFNFVLPGSYEIRVTPPEGSVYASALLSGGITLSSGGSVTADTVVLLQP